MTRTPARLPLWLTAAALLLGSGPAAAQHDRRDRRDPELTVETGARTGTCDALAFSPDGKFLFAVGDDKVARAWPCSPEGLDAAHSQVLRWPGSREQRGGIKALALSRDPAYSEIAVGGFGMRTSTVTLLDRQTGEVTDSVSPGVGYGVMAIAFSPSGRRVAFGTAEGKVWLWERDNWLWPCRRAGGHTHPQKAEFNRVRLVHFLDEDTLLSVAESGSVGKWDLAAGTGAKLFDFNDGLPGMGLYRAAISPDGRWLAAACFGPRVVVRSLEGDDRRVIELNGKLDEFPRAIAFNPSSDKLAVAVGSVVPPGEGEPKFFIEADDRIRIYDLSRPKPAARPGPPHTGRAQAIAWHSDAQFAVAGGEHHEVTLWDLGKPAAPKSVVLGPGRCLYDVRISDDGRYLAFRPDRDPRATHPNRLGAGKWHAFDLIARRAVPLPADVRFPEPKESLGGWSVLPGKVSWQWLVVSPDGRRFALPWDKARDETPRCYSFLPPAKPGGPVRLAVGHIYGASLFELTDRGPKRVRLFTGHAGEVMSLAVAANGDWLVTAADDQTIAAWSLKPWESQRELGAAFDARGGKVFVERAEPGSPGWEAGLREPAFEDGKKVREGDEVLFLASGARPVYDPAGRYGARFGYERLGTPKDALAALRDPAPGVELYFEVKRDGRGEPLKLLTSVRQRPMWRFFPAFTDGEVTDWVLWMWRNSYYATSTNGDYLIGWHVNHPSLEGTPRFYRAEQFRDFFHRPDVVTRLLVTRDVGEALRLAMGPNPVQVNFANLEPAPVGVELGEPGAAGVPARLTVRARGDNPDLLPRRVELWINDYRHRVWDTGGRAFEQQVLLPADRLRAGENRVTLQAFNDLGGRGEATATLVNPRPPEPPRLFGLAVGIDDYSQHRKLTEARGGARQAFGDLSAAVSDARQLRASWMKQKGRFYADAMIALELNADATRGAILKRLDELAEVVRPDDRLVLFLSGHGDFLTPRRAAGKAGPDAAGGRGIPGDGVFVFACPRYDPERYKTTGITTEELYEKLAAIPCRKLVFLDACHSGQAAVNPVRSLTPAGMGPTILAACDQNEVAFEHPKFGNGLFSFAVLEALGGKSEQADFDIDGLLSPLEIYAYVRRRMPGLLEEAGKPPDVQNPVCFPRRPDSAPVAKR